MTTKRARVGLARTASRRQNIYRALDLVRADVTPLIREQVLLKPNFLSGSNQLASSHADAMRGAIDFLLSTPKPPDEILIAEGGNENYAGEAWDVFGYHALLDEYRVPIKLIDLNTESNWVETPIVLADHSETVVRMPKTVLDCPCTISVAIAKTHDVCVVTLALKNMIMGTLYKPDRVKMHGFNSHGERTLPAEAQTLNINLIRLARFLAPDIAVVDGTRGLQGNGPGGEDGVDLGIAAASSDDRLGPHGTAYVSQRVVDADCGVSVLIHGRHLLHTRDQDEAMLDHRGAQALKDICLCRVLVAMEVVLALLLNVIDFFHHRIHGAEDDSFR